MAVRHSRYVPLPDTAPIHPPGAQLAAVDLDQNLEVTIVLRPAMAWSTVDATIARLARQHPANRRYLTGAEFIHRCGARPADVERVLDFVTRHKLEVRDVNKGARSIKVGGPLAAFERAFDTRFAHFAPAGSPDYRSHTGTINVPAALAGIVTDAIGFSDRRFVLRHAVSAHRPHHGHAFAHLVARSYEFPDDVDVRGDAIALIELGGGLDPADIALYAKRAGLDAPRVTIIRIDGQANRPASAQTIQSSLDRLRSGTADASSIPDSFWATVEATMDAELVTSFAPGAHIIVYLADETPRGKFDALSAAVTDAVNQPFVISCSWGVYECEAPPHVMRSLDEVFRLAALRGITVCASSGDFGDGTAMCGKASAHFPASSPHVLACGGTHLPLSGDRSGEVVWDEQLGPVRMSSGGGFSSLFRRPSWQKRQPGATGRGVPDVAAKADVISGYCILVRGIDMAMGGTSAAAPLWASLIAIANHRTGTRAGLFAPSLYSRAFAKATRPIIEGSNGAFHAGPGWNPCTGLGSPNAGRLLAALSGGGRARRSKSPRSRRRLRRRST